MCCLTTAKRERSCSRIDISKSTLKSSVKGKKKLSVFIVIYIEGTVKEF